MTMRHTRLVATLAMLGALATALAACTTSEAKSVDGASTPATRSTTPGPSAPSISATKSPTQTAQAAAKSMVAKYYKAGDEGLFAPRKTSSDFFKRAAVGSALADQQNSWIAAKGQNLRQTGRTTLKSVELLKTDLTNRPKASPPNVPTVQFLVCYDVSKVNIVDKDGKSVVPASRRPTGFVLVGVSNYNYPSRDGWRVAYTKKKADSC